MGLHNYNINLYKLESIIVITLAANPSYDNMVDENVIFQLFNLDYTLAPLGGAPPRLSFFEKNNDSDNKMIWIFRKKNKMFLNASKKIYIFTMKRCT